MTLILGIILPTVAQKIPAYVPTNGLVGWWPFNGNANDESGNNNNGTVNGATLTTDRNGIVNSAYSFDGVDDFINILNNNSICPTSSISLCCWIKSRSTANFDRIINKSHNVAQNYATYQLLTRNASMNTTPGFTLRFGTGISGSSNDYSYSGDKIGKVYFDNWQFIVGTWDGLTMKFYQNGNLISTIPRTGSLHYTNGDLQFGKGTGGTGLQQFYKGEIDDISIYNRALSDQEIKQLYEGCSKETAMSSSFNSVVYTTNGSVNLSANPTGGIFKGDAVTNNAFDPTKGKLGKNQVKYNFKNSSGCSDSTNFAMILVDTVGNKCSTYDTLKIKVKLTTGINKDQYTNVTVYPNPTSDILVIVTPDEKILSGYKYRILDIQGKEVYNASISTAKTEIDINKLGSKGVYILHIVDANGTSIENKKIVLE